MGQNLKQYNVIFDVPENWACPDMDGITAQIERHFGSVISASFEDVPDLGVPCSEQISEPPRKEVFRAIEIPLSLYQIVKLPGTDDDPRVQISASTKGGSKLNLVLGGDAAKKISVGSKVSVTIVFDQPFSLED